VTVYGRGERCDTDKFMLEVLDKCESKVKKDNHRYLTTETNVKKSSVGFGEDERISDL